MFKAKKDTIGIVICFKAWLVAQGFLQSKVDYFDTYTFVAKLASILTVLVIVTVLNMKIHQINIKRVYLNGKLSDDEVIYMKQLSSFEDSKFPYHMYHL